MIELTEENKQKIKKLVDQITKISIGDQNPNGFCFSICFVLTIYLDIQGISTSIVWGKMNDVDHFWLELNGYHNIIIDATLKQFDEYNSQVDSIYFGNILENDITKQYRKEFISFNQWISLYHIWCNPNIDKNGWPRQKDFVTKIVVNNLTAASILNYEIENIVSENKLSITKSSLYKFYFGSIANMLKLNVIVGNEIIALTRSKVGDKFNSLLLNLPKVVSDGLYYTALH